jgi:ADP-heptose:LPS heptosyltransferase
VITGTKDEADIVNDVIDHMKQLAVNLAGKTSMGAMGILIKNAYAMISNCTGVSHIASAFKTPSIVISMDGEPERWGPINHKIHRTINWLDRPDFSKVYDEATQLLRVQD